MEQTLTLYAVKGIPLVKPGDDLFEIINKAISKSSERLQNGDILVIAQKIVSKVENRIISLNDVEPSREALKIALETDKDPRQIELVLRESREIIRHRPGVIIVEQNLGIIMANAGIDHSNIENEGDEVQVLLLPEDPDETCRKLQTQIRETLNVSIGVIINDSVGRAWRVGTTGLAIGVAGLPAVVDLRGEKDIFGRELLVSEQAVADELASAASLLQGQASEKLPVVIVRGFNSDAPHQNASALIRDKEMDMFR